MQRESITETNITKFHLVTHLKDSFHPSEGTLIEEGRAAGGTVQFSFDNKVLASSGFDTSLHIFDTITHQKIYSKYATGATYVGDSHSLSFHPSKDILITNYERNVMLLNYTKGISQIFENATLGQDWSKPFNRDGTLWAQTHDSNHRRISIYDLESRTKKYELDGHTSIVSGVVFSPDNKLLATAGDYISSGRIDETV